MFKVKKIAVVPIGEAGKFLAGDLRHDFHAAIIRRSSVGACWHDFDAFVFIGAMGICVRTIAPYIKDKHTDPAVVCMDSLGRHVVSVLSGHVGGANELTERISFYLGAQPVITTQSDLAGLWALDTLGRRFDWYGFLTTGLNGCIIDFVNRCPTALVMDIRDEGTDYLERTLPDHVTIVEDVETAIRDDYPLLIVVSPFWHGTIDNYQGKIVYFVPRCLSFGFGLAHQAKPAARILREMEEVIRHAGLLCYHQTWCSIDVKSDEPFVRALRRAGIDAKLRFFTAEELAAVEVPNPSATVQQHVGTPSVCEAALLWKKTS